MSLGVTSRSRPSPRGGSSSCPSRSAARVDASTTVGTPTASTGTPREARSRAHRWLPTPEPGAIPVSDSCTVRHSRFKDREARASTATTQAGFSLRHTAWTSSPLSIPVVPSTPADREATGRKAPKCSGICSTRWRVTRVCSWTLGPMASGVMARLPSPTTSTSPRPGTPSMSWASSPPTARAARGKASSSRRARPSMVRVTYRPAGLPRASSPRSSRMCTVSVKNPSRVSVKASTPSSLAVCRALSSHSSLASRARSVLRCRIWVPSLYKFVCPAPGRSPGAGACSP